MAGYKQPNSIVEPVTGDGVSLTVNDIGFSIATGNMPGYSTKSKFGVNPEITTGSDPEDVWEFGGIYPFDANGTAPIMYISSDSSADTVDVIVEGLDIDGNAVSEMRTLTGQTPVLLEIGLWRVNRMYNDGNVDIVGVVYCHTDPEPVAGVPADENVRCIINGDHNQSLMAIYTIPAGKVGFMTYGEAGVELSGSVNNLADFAHIHYEIRLHGKVFRVQKAISCIVGGMPNYQVPISDPIPIPPLTDIKAHVTEVSATMGIWAAFSIRLVDIDKLSPAFVASLP
jgi:hypothetical protein